MDKKELKSYIPGVEGAIERLGVPVADARTDEELRWYFHRGEAQLAMFLRASTMHNGDTRPVLVMVSPLMPVPQDRIKQMELYEYTLEMTHKLVTESFSVAEGWLYLSTTYFMDDLSEKEIIVLLDSLSFFAQVFASELKAKYYEEPAAETEGAEETKEEQVETEKTEE